MASFALGSTFLVLLLGTIVVAAMIPGNKLANLYGSFFQEPPSSSFVIGAFFITLWIAGCTTGTLVVGIILIVLIWQRKHEH